MSFYLNVEQQRGYVYGPEGWAQLGPAPTSSSVSDPGYISAIATPPEDPDRIYAVWEFDTKVHRSSDRGATWTAYAIDAMPALDPSIYRMVARGSEVYLLAWWGSAAYDGIWRSLDEGETWTRVIALPWVSGRPSPSSFDVGSSKLWYTQMTAVTIGSANSTWAFHRANLDGSSIETLGTSDFAFEQSTVLIRAYDDSFALATTYRGEALLRVDGAGLTDVRPAALTIPWNALALDALTWLAVGTDGSTLDVRVYRTTNAGSSWTLVTTITALEGFAQEGNPDTWPQMIDADPHDRSQTYMLGHASPTQQQIVWVSSTGGVSWSQLLNAADPSMLVPYPGGLVARALPTMPMVAIPARLATIVG